MRYNGVMIYFICALMPEARPVIDQYGLKRSEALPFPLFTGEEAVLLVCGMGEEASVIAASALLGWRRPAAEDLLVNLGICAAPEAFAVGTPLLAHELRAGARRRYPDILFKHPCAETTLESVDTPLHQRLPHPADMEAFGIYRAAERFFEAHRMLFFKVVSDHFSPESVDKASVPSLIADALPHLRQTLTAAAQFTRPASLFDAEEQARLEALRSLFTKSQFDTLLDACRYYKLRHAAPLPPEVAATGEAQGKAQRRELLERLAARLTV